MTTLGSSMTAQTLRNRGGQLGRHIDTMLMQSTGSPLLVRVLCDPDPGRCPFLLKDDLVDLLVGDLAGELVDGLVVVGQ